MAAQRATARDAKYPLGAAMVLAGGLCLSFGGLLLRYIEDADGWTILFYRSIAFTLTVLVLVVVRHRGRTTRAFLEIGWNGVLAAASLGAGFTFYVFAMLLTTVANVVFTISAGPLFAAVLGWMLLGERVRPATWLAIFLALAGISLMFADGLATGNPIGNFVALGVPLSFASMIIFMRRGKNFDMVPAICLAGVFSTVASAVMADGLDISGRDLALCILLGAGQVGGGFTLITLGIRYVPAAEVALFSFTETIFAPIWVWLAIGEVPNPLAMAGGAVVFVSVAGRMVVGMVEQRRQAPGPRGGEGVA